MAHRAELAELKAIFECLFIFTRKIVGGFTRRTLKFDHVVLGHTRN